MSSRGFDPPPPKELLDALVTYRHTVWTHECHGEDGWREAALAFLPVLQRYAQEGVKLAELLLPDLQGSLEAPSREAYWRGRSARVSGSRSGRSRRW